MNLDFFVDLRLAHPTSPLVAHGYRDRRDTRMVRESKTRHWKRQCYSCGVVPRWGEGCLRPEGKAEYQLFIDPTRGGPISIQTYRSNLNRAELIFRVISVFLGIRVVCVLILPGLSASRNLPWMYPFVPSKELMSLSAGGAWEGEISLFTDPAHRPRRKPESCKRLPELGLVPARRSVTSGSARAQFPWAEPWGCTVGERLGFPMKRILALTSVLRIVTYRGDNQQ